MFLCCIKGAELQPSQFYTTIILCKMFLSSSFSRSEKGFPGMLYVVDVFSNFMV